MNIPRASLPTRIFFLVLGALCLVLGLLGLVMPLLPGFLFLFGAVYLFGKASRRFRRWSEQQPAINAMQARVDQLGRVSVMDRIRVGALMSVGAFAAGLAVMAEYTGRIVGGLRQAR